MQKLLFIIGLCLFVTLTSCPLPQKENLVETQMNISGIPGPRTFFWSCGPVSADPYMNIAYPDAGVFYWSAVFTMPEGATLKLEGEFPHSRYMSFISYDGRGIPQESMADYLINADEDHANPFLEGADRTNPKRSRTHQKQSRTNQKRSRKHQKQSRNNPGTVAKQSRNSQEPIQKQSRKH